MASRVSPRSLLSRNFVGIPSRGNSNKIPTTRPPESRIVLSSIVLVKNYTKRHGRVARRDTRELARDDGVINNLRTRPSSSSISRVTCSISALRRRKWRAYFSTLLRRLFRPRHERSKSQTSRLPVVRSLDFLAVLLRHPRHPARTFNPFLPSMRIARASV